jgi:formylglycine-generating enzyme
MRKILFFILISAVSFSFSVSRKKKLIPPGTVQITQSFFVDQTEISNFSWREYELWIARKYGPNSPQHNAAKPDTLVWVEKGTYNEPYSNMYYRHPAYKDYPVVGISYEQALAFCKWRTGRVKEFYAIRHKKDWAIEYRLPTKEEWEAFSFTYGIPNFKNGKNEKGKITLNCARPLSDTVGTAGFMNDNADVTAPVFSYWPNAFKIYNCFGNVAEMVSEKGISKGGSWRHTTEECRAGKDISYSKPTAWLGFRCVCVISEKQ